MKRAFLNIFIFLALFLAAERVCYWRTSGFMFQKVLSPLPPHPQFATAKPTQEELAALREACSQPLTLLGKGNECYAFASADGKYVLKLFKHQLFRLSYLKHAVIGWSGIGHTHTLKDAPYLEFCEKCALEKLPILEGVKRARQKRLERTFSSCRLAHERLKKECGIITMNVAKDGKTDLVATLTDRLGNTYRLALDQTEYLLQQRAVPVREKLVHLAKENKAEEVKASIASILALVQKRAQMGILDRDPRIQDNFGLIGTEAIEFDTGSFLQNSNYSRDTLVETDTAPFYTWLITKGLQRK